MASLLGMIRLKIRLGPFWFLTQNGLTVSQSQTIYFKYLAKKNYICQVHPSLATTVSRLGHLCLYGAILSSILYCL